MPTATGAPARGVPQAVDLQDQRRGRANDITYNRLIQGLKAAGVEVDRKNLAEIAVSDPAAFTALVEVAKGALPSDVNAPSTSTDSARLPDAHRTL